MAWAKAKPGFNGRMKEQALTSKWRIKEEKTRKIGDGNPACLPLEVFGYKISFAFMAWRMIFRRISTNEIR
jgi:hypothetical protein